MNSLIITQLSHVTRRPDFFIHDKVSKPPTLVPSEDNPPRVAPHLVNPPIAITC